MTFKESDKVKLNKNNKDIKENCMTNCSRQTCHIKYNLNVIFIVKLNNPGYKLLYKENESVCYFTEEHLLPAMKWIRMK